MNVLVGSSTVLLSVSSPLSLTSSTRLLSNWLIDLPRTLLSIVPASTSADLIL